MARGVKTTQYGSSCSGILPDYLISIITTARTLFRNKPGADAVILRYWELLYQFVFCGKAKPLAFNIK